MIKKSVLDAIDKKLLNMRTLHSYLKKHSRKNDSLARDAYKALKRESRSVDTIMRDALQQGNVEFSSENKIR